MKKVTIFITIIVGMAVAMGSIKCEALDYVYKKLSQPTLRHPNEIEINKETKFLFCSPKRHYLEIRTKMPPNDHKVKFKVYRKKQE